MTAPPVEDAGVEVAVPDAVDEPVVLGAAAEPDELAAVAELDATGVVELAEPPATGVGVGLPGASSKFAQARRVRLWEWMTMLRFPKKEPRPGVVET
jgi:hypothetical protein